jgi:hypothetical protein
MELCISSEKNKIDSSANTGIKIGTANFQI